MGALPSYPLIVPGFGKVDISTLVLEGGVERLRSLLFAEDPMQ